MNTEMIVCDQCNASLQAGSRFCPNCGRSFLPRAVAADPLAEGLSWETNISLLTNPLILKQMALMVFGAGFVMAFLLSFILAVTGEFSGIPPMLLISLLASIALAIFLGLIMLLFFGNRMRVRFTVDGKGVLWETVDKRAKAAGRLAIVAGILGRSPQAAGAGALAVSREKEFVRWQDLSAVDYNKGRLMLTLRNSWRPLMLVVCLPENFGRVAVFVEKNVVPTPVEALPRRGAGPLAKGLWRTLLVSLAVVPVFALSSYPFELDIFLPLLMFLFALATVWLLPLFGWVVIASAAILAVQIGWISFLEIRSLHGLEIAAILIPYGGLAYLVWFSRSALRGKVRSVLLDG